MQHLLNLRWTYIESLIYDILKMLIQCYKTYYIYVNITHTKCHQIWTTAVTMKLV